jgi:hypothetical protein
MKKNKSLQQRTRQKLSRKKIIIIGLITLNCAIISLVVFFNMTNVKESKASDITIRMMTDQEFTTEKSIAIPVITPGPVADSKTVFIKQKKVLPPSYSPSIQ